jgi:hypothetical protein
MSSNDRAPSSAFAGAESNASDVLTMDEIYDRYSGEWILLRITEDDDDHWLAAGRIMIRAPTQHELLAELKLLTADGPLPGRGSGPLCMFCAYPDIKPGPEFEALLAELRPEFPAPS